MPASLRLVLGLGVAAAAAIALVAALLVGGGADPPVLGDPGALVRFGLPAAKAVTYLAEAATIGALAAAAFLLPPGPAAWGQVLRLAGGAAVVWTIAALVRLVLGYANVAGRGVGGPGFGAELASFVTTVSLGRSLLGVVLVAAVTAVVVVTVRTPRGALLAGVLASIALVLQSQTGHAAGSTNHELAISGMFLHLMGVVLWVGGLVTVAVVSGRLGADLASVVRRYSVLAGWCFLAVALSGVVSAALRLGGWHLATGYGALVVAKAALLSALGVVGGWHRRLVIARLPGTRRLFWRLAGVELVVMGAVLGVAVALAATPPPVPQTITGALTPAEIVTGHPLPPAPTPELWLTAFRWDLLVAAGCAAALVTYLRWVRRLAARGDRWPVGRTLSLVVGLVLLAWTTSGGPAVYGHVLFSAHMVQHMLLVMVVPIFLVLAAPMTLALRALPRRRDGSRGPREWLLGVLDSRLARFLSHPVVAAVNFAGSMVVFYFTGLFELALTTYLGHLAMVVHFTVAGYLFVNALIGVDPGPRRPAHPVRLLLLFATMAFHAFFGLALTTGESLLAPEWFGLLGRPWGPSALADQQDGGAIAWGVSELPMLALAIALAIAWTQADERSARRADRAADRSGDAELVAYNEMLSRLGDAPSGGKVRRPR